ncbi:MAG: phage portal protein [Alphaproteobacteria bacterium]|nr:phage portal protein [Alphaproteobacteria bacterium]
MFNFFRKMNDYGDKKPEPKKPEQKAPVKNEIPYFHNRRFAGATFNPNNRFNISWNKINADLRNDGIQLILRCRDLAKNNEMVASYLNWVIRSVLGDQGFRLNCVSYNSDGTSNLKANQQIEDAWYEFAKSYKKFVSADEQLNDIEMDTQILWNYLIDG